MGLSYDSDDSNTMKTALSANLATASAVLVTVESASDRLVTGLGTGELSGMGYSAVNALFAWIIAPCITRAKGELDAIRGELDTYVLADSKVSRYGVLAEDALHTQLIATRNQRDATEQLIEFNISAGDLIVAAPGLSGALQLRNAQLELVLNQLENDLRDLDARLGALRAFASATQGLFRDGVTRLEAAISETVALLEQLGPTNGGSRVAGGVAVAARKKMLDFLGRLGASKDWATATPGELSSLLNDLSPSQMRTMLEAHPELLQRFWDHPPAPEKAAAW